MSEKINPCLPMDLALTRWAVVCRQWHELSGGSTPLLGAFLAGWYCRCIGASMPDELGDFKDSFRRGWIEAEQQIEIEGRSMR